MENATKALLIAAAVLIAILIISFGLIIYNMASETVGNVDLSEAEIAQFNAKFKSYEGSKVSKTRVNALVKTVLEHNQLETKNGTDRYVEVKARNGIDSTKTILPTNAESLASNTVPVQIRFFKVECMYKDGLINEIILTALSIK